jgi:hypothetical protein
MLQKTIKRMSIAGFVVGVVFGQADSRLEELAAQQSRKAAQLKPEEPNKIERGLIWFRESGVLERFTGGVSGFRPKIGGLASGSGFGFGPEYHLEGRVLTLRTSAQSSLRGYRKFDFEVAAPKLSSGRFFAEIYGVHHNYPSLSYYGPGPDSEKAGRTDFRLEDTAIDSMFGVRPIKHLSIGASGGYLFNNVGPGTDKRYASSERVYTPAQAPGIDVQQNFSRIGTFAQYDWRDDPGGARRGGNYFAQFSDYRKFRRLNMEAQQFLPVLNERRVFALRAKSTLTFRDGGEPIPFYMQPTLGGSDDLRGYRPYRFRGDNVLVMNAEYRWEIFSGLDMALFADGGKVFAHKSDLDFRNLESDAGFGFRFNARNRTFLRLDVGFSHEGFQVWVKFSNIFKRGLIRTSSSMEDF